MGNQFYERLILERCAHNIEDYVTWIEEVPLFIFEQLNNDVLGLNVSTCYLFGFPKKKWKHITLILLIQGTNTFFLPSTSSFLQSKWGASSLLQLNLQNHELYIAHNPTTQDIHNTFIFFYLCINDCSIKSQLKFFINVYQAMVAQFQHQ